LAFVIATFGFGTATFFPAVAAALLVSDFALAFALAFVIATFGFGFGAGLGDGFGETFVTGFAAAFGATLVDAAFTGVAFAGATFTGVPAVTLLTCFAFVTCSPPLPL
jgi:hypothetical protein